MNEEIGEGAKTALMTPELRETRVESATEDLVTSEERKKKVEDTPGDRKDPEREEEKEPEILVPQVAPQREELAGARREEPRAEARQLTPVYSVENVAPKEVTPQDPASCTRTSRRESVTSVTQDSTTTTNAEPLWRRTGRRRTEEI